MSTAIDDFVRQQLETWRERLRETLGERTSHPAHLHALLREVDSALDRIANGCYGICEACHDTIGTDRLICDPLVRFCLDHLSGQERDALEHASHVFAQSTLPNEYATIVCGRALPDGRIEISNAGHPALC